MPSIDTQRIALRLREMAVFLSQSSMHWGDIYKELEKQKRDDEYLGKPRSTEKIVAAARKTESGSEDRPWQIDMVGEGTHVPPEALADVLGVWRWHTVGRGTVFTVRMAKWVSRMRFLIGRNGLKIDVRNQLSRKGNVASEAEIWDGLLARQSLDLARVSMRLAVEEIACAALKREFKPIGQMIEFAWEGLDQSRDVIRHHLRQKAQMQVREMINQTGGDEMLGYETAIWAKSWVKEWRSDTITLSGEEGMWPVLLPYLDPLDPLANEVLNEITSSTSMNPRWEVAELVILKARNEFPDETNWQKQRETAKKEYVKGALHWATVELAVTRG